MSIKPFYKSEMMVIAAGDSRTVQRVSNFITCLEASSGFRIQIDNSPETEFQKGLTFTSQVDFSQVRFVNDTDEELIIKIGFGRGGVRDGRLVLDGDTTITANLTEESTVLSVHSKEAATIYQRPSSPDNTSAINGVSFNPGDKKVLADANPNRKRLIIHFYSGSGFLRVGFGDSNGTQAEIAMPYYIWKITPSDQNNNLQIEGGSRVFAISKAGCLITLVEEVYV